MKGPTEIGNVTWARGKLRAVLLGNRTWQCDDASLAASLAVLFPARSPQWWGPSAGRTGAKVLNAAAEMFGGGIVEQADDDSDEGRVY